MKKIRWLWNWFRRVALRARTYTTFLLGILVGSLPTERNALLYAYWDGPAHLRIAVWAATLLLMASLSLALYDRASHRKLPRAQFFHENAHSLLADWDTDPHWLPFDRLFEITAAPNMIEADRHSEKPGWRPSDVVLQVQGEFPNAPRLEERYRQWRAKTDHKKLDKDGIKYVVRNYPTSETDEHFVRVLLETTRWSRVQSFLDHTRTERQVLFQTADPALTPGRKPYLDLSKSECPHAFGLHAVVITSDNKLLALQRPDAGRTDYYPLMWSFSFEEQLSDRDLGADDSETDVQAWLVRAVRQEILGQEVDTYFNVDDARILSIIHEEEFCNPSLVGVTPVRCSSVQLASILPHAPDRAEWIRFDFYSLDPPYDALALAFSTGRHVDGRLLHPTSRYRIFMTLSAITPPSLFNVGQRLRLASRHA